MKNDKTTKRSFRFCFEGGDTADINIDRVTSIHRDVKRVLLHLDETEDGKHLLIVNEKLWDLSKQKLIRIEIVRE